MRTGIATRSIDSQPRPGRIAKNGSLGNSRARSRGSCRQIGQALGELAPFAADLGQELRLEVHGSCADPRVIESIMEVADHPAARVCWNSNPQDLLGEGLVDNFRRLRPWFGRTLHVRGLPRPEYPVASLMHLLDESDWDGWVLLEAHSAPGPKNERAAALAAQRRAHDAVVAAARGERFDGPVRATEPDAITAGSRTIARRRTDRVPVLHPLFAAGGRQVVRGYPLDPRDGETRDHPHHVGFWIAHGDVDGHDFWHAPECRIKLETETVTENGDDLVLDWSCAWTASGEPVLDERRRMRLTARGLATRLDVDFTLTPRAATVTFGDTKEGFFALRLTPELKVDGNDGRARLVNAHGDAGRDAWGKRAPWVMAEGIVDGRVVRVRMSDHRDNPRHPTWWHARTYGLVAANPFGRRAFQGRRSGDGAMVIRRDEPLRLRYRIETEVF